MDESAERGDVRKMSREPNDPMVIMLAAVGRRLARDELACLHGIASAARRFVEEWERFCKAHDVKDPDLMVQWLSHERRDRAETWPLDAEIDRLLGWAKDYDRARQSQGEMNRIRLALMGDPDFRGGEAWEGLIAACEETASSSASRRR